MEEREFHIPDVRRSIEQLRETLAYTRQSVQELHRVLDEVRATREAASRIREAGILNQERIARLVAEWDSAKSFFK
jgi:hypothetical protein